MQPGGPVPLGQRRAAARATGARRRCRPRVAPAAHEVGHGPDGQLVGLDRLDLVPGERRRHLAARPGPGEPRAEDRLVRGVLVEVDEDAAAPLLLPPVRRDQVGVPPLELACQRDRRGAHLEAVPARLEADVDVEARCCRSSWGSPRMPSSSSSVAAVQAAARTSSKPMPGLRVEVDAQLVGVRRVVGAVRPQVQAEAAEVDGPHARARCRPPRARWTWCRSGWRHVVDCSQSGAPFGTRFWKKDLPAAPSGNRCSMAGRPPAVLSRWSRDVEVVRDEVELGGAELGEVHLVRAARCAPRGRRPPPCARRPRAPPSTLVTGRRRLRRCCSGVGTPVGVRRDGERARRRGRGRRRRPEPGWRHAGCRSAPPAPRTTPGAWRRPGPSGTARRAARTPRSGSAPRVFRRSRGW